MTESRPFSPPLSTLRDPVHLLATGFGSGLVKPAPGTWGSVAAVVVFGLLLQHLPLFVFLVLIVAGAFAGIYLCGKTAEDWGVHDHGSIVWDEWIGQWIALIGLAAYPVWWLVAFAYFRLFDIWKPGPVGWADRQFDGGVGIMLDDLLAGVLAGLATWGTMLLTARGAAGWL